MGNYIKLFSVALIMSLLFGSTSCSSEKDGGGEPLPTKFEVPATPILFDADADSDVINVTAENVTWEAEVEEKAQTWLTISSNKETGVITVNVSENKESEERDGIITITPNHTEYKAVEVKVVQNGTYSIIYGDDELDFGYNDDEPQYVTVRASSGISWSVSPNSQFGWLKVTKEVAENRVRVTVDENTTTDPLVGTFTITNDSDLPSKVITVRQGGKPVLEVDETEVTFTISNDQTEEIGVTAFNVDWNYRIDKMTGSWLTATKGANGDKITLKIVEGNETGAPRSAEVVLYADGIQESPVIYVTQRGKPVLEVAPETVTFAFDETTPQVVNVNANEVDWDVNVTTKPSWLTVEADYDENTITLTATDNTVGEYRSWTLVVFDKDEKLDDAEVFIEQPMEWSMIFDQITGQRADPIPSWGQTDYGFTVYMGISDDERPLRITQEFKLVGDLYASPKLTGNVLQLTFYSSEDVGPNRLQPQMKPGTYQVSGYGTTDGQVSSIIHSQYKEENTNAVNVTGWTGGTVTVSYEGDNVVIVADIVNDNGTAMRTKYEGPMWLDDSSKAPYSMLTQNTELEGFTRAVAYYRGKIWSQMPAVGFNVWHLYLVKGEIEITPTNTLNTLETLEGDGGAFRIALLTSDNESAGFPTGTFVVTNEGEWADKKTMGGYYFRSQIARGSWYIERQAGRPTNSFEAPLAGGSVMIMGNANNATVIVSGTDGGWNVTDLVYVNPWDETPTPQIGGDPYELGCIYEGPIEVIF